MKSVVAAVCTSKALCKKSAVKTLRCYKCLRDVIFDDQIRKSQNCSVCSPTSLFYERLMQETNSESLTGYCVCLFEPRTTRRLPREALSALRFYGRRQLVLL